MKQHYYYYYRYSALRPVWAETRVQSGDWYGSGTLHRGQVLRGSLPLLSPAFFRFRNFKKIRIYFNIFCDDDARSHRFSRADWLTHNPPRGQTHETLLTGGIVMKATYHGTGLPDSEQANPKFDGLRRTM